MKIIFQELLDSFKEAKQVWTKALSNNFINRDQWHPDNIDSLKIHEDLLNLKWEELCIRHATYSDRVEKTIQPVMGNVLEVGCGAGNITKWIVAKDSVESVMAIESSPIAFDKLTAGQFNFFHKVVPVMSSMRAFSPPAGLIYDTVVLSEIIEHIELEEELTFLDKVRPAIRYVRSDDGENTGTRFVVSTPIGFMKDPHHVRGFSKSMFLHHLERYYGEIKNIYYGRVQQIAWGFFA